MFFIFFVCVCVGNYSFLINIHIYIYNYITVYIYTHIIYIYNTVIPYISSRGLVWFSTVHPVYLNKVHKEGWQTNSNHMFLLRKRGMENVPFVYSITFSILNLLVYPKLVVEDNASDFQGARLASVLWHSDMSTAYTGWIRCHWQVWSVKSNHSNHSLSIEVGGEGKETDAVSLLDENVQ